MSEKMKLLIVDDNEEYCQNLRDILELRDYEVTIALDGFQGLELVKRGRFDLVLMDVKMPVMDGVETFKKMKHITEGVPVIMITAYAVEDLISEALREGAYGFLRKPVDFDQLFELVSRATGTGGMILLADDDEVLCSNLTDVLQSRGYRVVVAYDGAAAVDRAKQNNFDILLLDMRLPALNGLETYLAICEFRPDVVAVVITGYRLEVEGLLRRAWQKNVYACLEKPLDMDQLLSLLAQVQEQRSTGKLEKPDWT